MGSYQDRKDIDNLYDELYDRTDGSLTVVRFIESSPYRSISSDEYNSDKGTIDAIIDYYGVTEIRDIQSDVDIIKNNIYNYVYPIGTVYQTTDSTFKPKDEFGGNWTLIDSTDNIYKWERVSEAE